MGQTGQNSLKMLESSKKCDGNPIPPSVTTFRSVVSSHFIQKALWTCSYTQMHLLKHMRGAPSPSQRVPLLSSPVPCLAVACSSPEKTGSLSNM